MMRLSVHRHGALAHPLVRRPFMHPGHASRPARAPTRSPMHPPSAAPPSSFSDPGSSFSEAPGAPDEDEAPANGDEGGDYAGSRDDSAPDDGPSEQEQSEMAGYPRVIGGYVAGYAPGTGIYGAEAPMVHMAPHVPVHGMAQPAIHSPSWRPMMAPGSPPLGEGHVFMPLNAETFGGMWGNTAGGGAAAGVTITFSARPQKPFKTARLIVRGTKSGTTAIGNLVGQAYVGTDLQQGEVGNVDLESIGAANAFDTWVSWKQAEPGVWIRVLATLTAFPTGTDFESYTITAIGHYLH